VICVGGHSASFVAKAIIDHGEGAIDCVLRGEGEACVPPLLAAIEAGGDLAAVPGAVTMDGEGPPPGFVHSLDDLLPARDLVRHRRKYSSACSTRAPRSSSRAVAPGIARSAAPGRFTGAAIAC